MLPEILRSSRPFAPFLALTCCIAWTWNSAHPAVPVHQATAGELLSKALLAQERSLQFFRLFTNQALTMPAPDQFRALCPRITHINVTKEGIGGSSTG